MAQQWNADGNYWFDDTQFGAGGAPVKSDFDTWLGTVSGNAPMQGKVKNYLSGLQTNYGLTTNDFDNALKSYGATYSDGGFLNDKNVGWWGEDAMLRAFGTGLDTLNPNAAYKGSWQSMWDQNAENAQQKDFADRFAKNEANQGSDLADLKDIALGASAVLGVGGLMGAFGGAGSALSGGEALSSPLAGAGSFEAGSALPAFGAGDGIASGLAAQASAGSGSVLGGVGSFNAGLTGGALGGIAGAGAATLPSLSTDALIPDASWGANPRTDVPAADPGGNTFTGTQAGGNDMSWLDDMIENLTGPGADTGANVWDTSYLNQLPSGPDILDVPGGLDAVNAGGPTGGTATPSWLTQLKNAPTSLLKSAFGLNDADASSMSSLLGKLAGAGLGAYASNQQANALADVAKQYAEYGAPYRAELGRLQSDPGSFLSSPRVTTAVDQGTNAMARALSARDGNPVGSGRALQEMQNYATNSLYGQLTNRENQLANFGGLSNFNAAAPSANLASVQQTGNMYNAIGAGINDIFNPQPTYLDLIKAMKGLA